MNRNFLLHLACPVCRSVLRLLEQRYRNGVVSSGVLMCPTCGYRGSVRARIPVLPPPGTEVVYRHPFMRTVGRHWEKWAELHGWDTLVGRVMTADTEQDLRSTALPPRIFRKSIFEGSDFYYESVLKNRDEDFPSPGKELEFLVTRLIAERPRLVLELGSGEGSLIRRLLPYRPGSGVVVCADIDYRSLKILEGYVRRTGFPEKAQGVACDLRRLPFPTRHFDAVVSLNGMAHVEGIDRLLGEVWRLLKPGGRFWITEPAFGTNLDVQKSVETLMLHGLRNKFNLHHGESDLVRRLNLSGFIIESAERHTTYQRHYTLISAVSSTVPPGLPDR